MALYTLGWGIDPPSLVRHVAALMTLLIPICL
jgi:hypothetical protein